MAEELFIVCLVAHELFMVRLHGFVCCVLGGKGNVNVCLAYGTLPGICLWCACLVVGELFIVCLLAHELFMVFLVAAAEELYTMCLFAHELLMVFLVAK